MVAKKSHKRILIVEDERPMAKILKLKLEHEGFEVDTAFNGEDGFNLATKESYDLIILDLIMPMVDGFTVLERLKKKRTKVPPVIVASNLSQPGDEERSRELGAVDYFVKSNTSLSDLVAKIIAFFDSTSTR